MATVRGGLAGGFKQACNGGFRRGLDGPPASEFSDKTTIFALSLDSFVCGGIIVNEHLLTGHRIAGTGVFYLYLGLLVMDGRVCLCGRTGALNIL